MGAHFPVKRATMYIILLDVDLELVVQTYIYASITSFTVFLSVSLKKRRNVYL